MARESASEAERAIEISGASTLITRHAPENYNTRITIVYTRGRKNSTRELLPQKIYKVGMLALFLSCVHSEEKENVHPGIDFSFLSHSVSCEHELRIMAKAECISSTWWL